MIKLYRHNCGIFNDGVSRSNDVPSNFAVAVNWKINGRVRPWLNLRYYSDI